ncbi:hypothetical protein AYO49_01730 [Verrucomicrobiaceae bacterium SCGC AG-212-N21]|nr:hypothetical protein AYO49_01730 [Verrucomicrobiaceae bacterium SCGC AG-212-N21]
MTARVLLSGLISMIAWTTSVQAQAPAAPTPRNFKVEFMGYEIPRADAAALMVKAPATLDAAPLLLHVAGLASRGTRNRVIPMPSVDVILGQRTGGTVGDVSIQMDARPVPNEANRTWLALVLQKGRSSCSLVAR